MLDRSGLVLAIASNASKQSVEAVLERLNINSYFSSIITSEDVIIPKPGPEIFLKALSELDADRNDAFVIEDSIVGILAATQAGLDVICCNSKLVVPEDMFCFRLTLEQLISCK
jgi:HAD superfamily hydrolase (TIGR01509 family)